MQDGRTPLRIAIDKDHHRIVEYFITENKMDISDFDVVSSIDTICSVCVYV